MSTPITEENLILMRKFIVDALMIEINRLVKRVDALEKSNELLEKKLSKTK